MRYNLALVLVCLLHAQATQATTITPEGLYTWRGFIKWDQVVEMPSRIDRLSLQLQMCTLGLAVMGAVMYMNWLDSSAQQNIHDHVEEARA